MNEVRNKPNDKFSAFRSENCRIIINLQKPVSRVIHKRDEPEGNVINLATYKCHKQLRGSSKTILREDLIFAKADKGGATVKLDVENYIEKANEELDNEDYCNKFNYNRT